MMYWKNFFSETFGEEGFTKINHKIYKKLGINAAFWIAEMHSWNRRLDIKYGENRKEPEWFYYEQRRMEKKGLSSQIQTRVSNKLSEIGLIEKKRMGNPSKNWYKINYELLTTYCFNSLETIKLIDCNLLNQLDSSNNKIENNKIEKEPSLFSSSDLFNWRKAEFKFKFDLIHSRHPKIDPIYLRYSINWQDRKLEKFTSFFKSYSDTKLINQIIDSCKTIDELIRIDKHYFRETIVPALKWASQDNFWHDKVLSLTNLRKKNKDGETKFTNILKQWCREEEIDPRKGRYVLESEVIRTPMINPKWTEYVKAKRKEQGIETDDPPEGLSQEGFEEFFKQKGNKEK